MIELSSIFLPRNQRHASGRIFGGSFCLWFINATPFSAASTFSM